MPVLVPLKLYISCAVFQQVKTLFLDHIFLPSDFFLGVATCKIVKDPLNSLFDAKERVINDPWFT